MPVKSLINTVLRRPELWAFLACVIVFLAWPQLDLIVASAFYENGHFYADEYPIVRAIYWLFARIHFLYLLGFIAAISYFSVKKQPIKRKASVFLLITLILGPGILVNIVLKDNSLGRPRPVHIQEFGGENHWTPVFHYSGECKKNCSFVSGHAAIGFYWLAFAWLGRRKQWLIAGFSMGAIVGFTRIIQGGHFLSDVIFAGWFTYFTYALIAYVMGIKHTHSSTESNIAKDANKQHNH